MQNKNKDEIINILDAGCGDGVLLFILKQKLKQYNLKITGIDLSEKALATAKQKIPSGNFIKAGVYEINVEPDFFDIVISSDVIEHVRYPEKMLAEIKRISKKDAYIIIGTPIRITEAPLDKMHVQEFFQEEFTNLMRAYFKSVKLHQTHRIIDWLKYRKIIKIFGIKIRLNRYLFNFAAIFRLNFFLKKNKNQINFLSYMYATCKK